MSVTIASIGALCTLLLAGCGPGGGSAPSAVELLVTRDFGSRVSHQTHLPVVGGRETLLSLLARNDAVSSRGGSVQSIDGLANGQEAGRPVGWFYYVNGVAPAGVAARTNVHPGDHIWWDRHDYSQAPQVPAVVGSFPEPFLNGIDGKRLPVRIECAAVAGYACRTVAARLQALAVPAAIAAIGAGPAPQTLRVMIGPWVDVQGDLATEQIAAGPGASGVYARFAANGRTLTLLDRDGRAARTLTAGAGLIAATRRGEDAPVWIVTGTDAAGVDLAASAFDTTSLERRFAVALSASEVLPLPDSSAL
jgi:Domain of unknown function (DUF4430)